MAVPICRRQVTQILSAPCTHLRHTLLYTPKLLTASDRSSRDACSLARAPGLRDPGVPAPGPALVPARAPPRCAAAACAAPSSRAGGYVPAAGRTVRSAGAAGSGLRGAATEPGQRVAASGRRAGGAGGGREEGEGGSARRAKEEGASERAAEGGRPTSSATIIHLKQVQQLSPCPAAKS